VRPDRVDPDRPVRPDLVDRFDRPDRGVRVEPGVGPVRLDVEAAGPVAVGAGADVAPAMPHVSQ
jgi:hypothetical protein